MKQSLLMRTSLVASIALFNLNVIAQSTTIAMATTPNLNKMSYHTAVVEMKEVNKAGNALVEQRFGKVSAIQWFTNGNYQTAYFNKDAKQVRAVYNDKGKFLYAIGTYTSMSNVPEKLLESLKAAYPNKSVYGVTELTGQSGTAYRAILKEPASMTTVQWVDGEIKEVEKLYQK